MESKRIARIIRQVFLKTPQFQGFTDVRRRPQISLQAILMSLWTMPLFGMRSLLSNDRQARTSRYKALFACGRKMVASDSTLARVLRWLNPHQVTEFLQSFLSDFDRRGLLRKRLCPTSRPRRLAILDGSYMGGHWQVTLCLAGGINYPIMVERCRNQGEEQAVARRMMGQATQLLGARRPEIWLLDALYFNVNTISIAREQRDHVLFKFKDADYRAVTADAQNLFQHFGGDQEATGWDCQRGCRWKVRKTVDSFHSYPVQVLQVTEFYPTRKCEHTVVSWVVTTELDLSLEEAREAAHQRWQIENGIFKRISHLAGTKTFYFKDHRQFFNLLRLFYTCLAVLDSIMVMLRTHPRVFAALRAGIKATWQNTFSRITEVLYGLPAVFVVLT